MDSWILLLSAGTLLYLCVLGWQLCSPRSPVLFASRGATWIRWDQEVRLGAWKVGDHYFLFRKQFVVSKVAPDAVLHFRSMKSVTVFLDELKLYEDPKDQDSWNRQREVKVPPLAAGSSHELAFLVGSRDSHCALWAVCEPLGIRTGTDWEVRGPSGWRPAMDAMHPPAPRLAAEFPTTFRSLRSTWQVLAILFAVASACAWLVATGRLPAPSPSKIRWGVLALVTLLAVNDLARLPLDQGMDLPGHLAYIRFLLEHHRIPLATDGWQMFQAPLYYLASIPIVLFTRGFGAAAVQYALRLIPWACGVAQTQLCYQALKSSFPGKEGLQIAGLVLGALLPINLALSQAVGNEPLSALLAAGSLVLVLSRVNDPAHLVSPKFGMWLGAVLGLAMLAKTSNLILLLLVPGFCLAWGLPPAAVHGLGDRVRAARRFLLPLFSTAFLLSGWYYIRNAWYLGSPFLGGWDSARGILWWQDHGYIPAPSIWRFGTALVQPIYAQTAGILDGLYATFWTDASLSGVTAYGIRPPWNYPFLLTSVLLSVFPSALMVLGAWIGWRERPVRLGVACILAYLAAIASVHLAANGAYSTLKSSYMLGLLPCFAVLCAAGWERLPRHPMVQALAAGWMAAWAGSTYLGFFIRGSAS